MEKTAKVQEEDSNDFGHLELEYYTKGRHNFWIEVLNSHSLQYCPKRIAFRRRFLPQLSPKLASNTKKISLNLSMENAHG